MVGSLRSVGVAGTLPPAGQHLAALRVHQPAGGARRLARLAGCPGVQQRGSPGEVRHPGRGKSAARLQWLTIPV